jgi:hypothetical protein
MEGRGRHRRLSPFVRPKSLPRAPWSVNPSHRRMVVACCSSIGPRCR